uniref:NADH dehydrogenase subunit 3 n=1 Tax=Tympanophyllum maximum TaxID=3039643 RepID=UPI002551E81D|nr:NADH dehydrogenase subunit 3 [Tympanophyllum maximum]WFP43221.1 NADH dehydrogenase subunit 3 [Tympanophyllum maximum]
MFIMLTISLIIIILSSILSMIASGISMKTISDQEKNSPFECGFDPKISARLPFSMHFFIIAVIFLIFDVEIALLLPLIIIFPKSSLPVWSMLSTFFISILLLGLFHEWNQGALDWAN